MIDLTNLDEIKKLDSKNVYGSTELFVNQCEQVLEDIKSFSFPDEYKKVKNIVFSGMGGSALGAQVVYFLYKDLLPIPFYINNDYTLPAFADSNTLVILSSYSGTTEETLSCANEATRLGCKVTAITTGGTLYGLMEENKIPYYKLEPKNNPCGQPRLGTGYSVFATIALLMKLGFINTNEEDLRISLEPVRKYNQMIKEEAIRLATALINKIPVIIAAEFMIGATHVLRNQFNETSKNFSSYSPLPELNHHLMEGLKNPHDSKLTVLAIESKLYSQKLQKRMQLTKEVVQKNNISTESYLAGSPDKLGQVLEVLSLGGYLTFYLSILYGQDPSLIPWVDYFKEKLK